MDTTEIARLYDFTGQTILITDGAGVLCSDWALVLAGCGATVVILGRHPAAIEQAGWQRWRTSSAPG